MKFVKAELIDKETGYIEAILYRTDNVDTALSCEVFDVYSWRCDTGKEPISAHYFVGASIKWDGCSHMDFNGNGYDRENKSAKDAYYHVCGLSEYYKFFACMLFMNEVAIKWIDNYFVPQNNRSVAEDMKKDIPFAETVGAVLMSKYEIKYSDEYDDYDDCIADVDDMSTLIK